MNKVKTLLKISLLMISIFYANYSYGCNTIEYNQALNLNNTGQYEKALIAYENLFKTGCPLSSFYLGNYYFYGIGTSVHLEKALYYYNKFLDNHNIIQPRDYRAKVYLSLFEFYYNKDKNKSFQFLTKSAELNNSEASFLLGKQYLTIGLKKQNSDFLKKSFSFLIKSSNLGNIKAMKLIYDHKLNELML